MKKTTIYFLRHGDVHNPKSLLYGRLPKFSLSKLGKEMIAEVAKDFQDKEITNIYTSPLRRARQTAQIIGDLLKIKPQVSPLINEVKLIHQGMSLKIFKSGVQDHLYDVENIKKGQESINQIETRMLKFFEKIIKRHKKEKIIVVSHGDPLVVLRAKIEKTSFTSGYKQRNYLKTGNYFTFISED